MHESPTAPTDRHVPAAPQKSPGSTTEIVDAVPTGRRERLAGLRRTVADERTDVDGALGRYAGRRRREREGCPRSTASRPGTATERCRPPCTRRSNRPEEPRTPECACTLRQAAWSPHTPPTDAQRVGERVRERVDRALLRRRGQQLKAGRRESSERRSHRWRRQALCGALHVSACTPARQPLASYARLSSAQQGAMLSQMAWANPSANAPFDPLTFCVMPPQEDAPTRRPAAAAARARHREKEGRRLMGEGWTCIRAHRWRWACHPNG